MLVGGIYEGVHHELCEVSFEDGELLVDRRRDVERRTRMVGFARLLELSRVDLLRGSVMPGFDFQVGDGVRGFNASTERSVRR